MKIKTLIFFFAALLAGFFFAYNNKKCKYAFSTKSRYEAAVQNIVDILSTIHLSCITNNCEITNIEATVQLQIESFNETKAPFSLFDSWGEELQISFLTNRYMQILSAGPDRKFDSSDDIVGKLALTNFLEIDVHGKYKDSVFRSSIFSTPVE